MWNTKSKIVENYITNIIAHRYIKYLVSFAKANSSGIGNGSSSNGNSRSHHRLPPQCIPSPHHRTTTIIINKNNQILPFLYVAHKVFSYHENKREKYESLYTLYIYIHHVWACIYMYNDFPFPFQYPPNRTARHIHQVHN